MPLLLAYKGRALRTFVHVLPSQMPFKFLGGDGFHLLDDCAGGNGFMKFCVEVPAFILPYL